MAETTTSPRPKDALNLAQAPLSEFARLRWPSVPWAVVAVIPFLLLIVINVAHANGNLLVVFSLLVIFGPIVWLLQKRALAQQRRRTVLAENAHDYKVSLAIRDAMNGLLDHIPETNDSVPGAIVRRDLSIGELARHFDTHTVGSVTGWLQHSLSGRGFSRSTSQVGLSGRDTWTSGQSSGILVGVSRVMLNMSAITRADLFAESFVAVFEERNPAGQLDTLRLVVPAEPACRAFIMETFEAIGKSFGVESHRHVQLRGAGTALRDAFKVDISYVSDRLNATLRMPVTERPVMTIVGSEVTPHAVVGGAVQFSDKPGEWHQLFPLGILHRVLEVVGVIGEPSIEALSGEEG